MRRAARENQRAVLLQRQLSEVVVAVEEVVVVVRAVGADHRGARWKEAEAATDGVFREIRVGVVEADHVLVTGGIKRDPDPATSSQKVVLLKIQTKNQTRVLRVTQATANRAKGLLLNRKIDINHVVRAGHLIGLHRRRFEKA